MSGLADPEVRFGSGIGKALRMLMRHSYAIILVSNLDRLGRRTDVFELIQAQGLGHRIMDAQTGMNLDELIAAKRHIKIAKKTKDQKRACKTGQERYLASGGVHGSPKIKHQSRHGTKRKMSLAKERRSQVLKVIAAMARQSRGRKLKLNDIADELNRREIRTGQGRFFDAERLSQLRKSYPGAFRKAFDTPLRDRRRIQAHVRTTGSVFANRHQMQQLMRTLAPIPRAWRFRPSAAHRLVFNGPKPTFATGRWFDRCRSPPPWSTRAGGAA